MRTASRKRRANQRRYSVSAHPPHVVAERKPYKRQPPKPAGWQENAACKGRAHLFFDEHIPPVVAEAKAICAECPVRAACIEFALTRPQERHGIWGGLTPDELDSERRRRSRAKAKERKAG
jgi:WhiB family redox-sensing transcriptional regulator